MERRRRGEIVPSHRRASLRAALESAPEPYLQLLADFVAVTGKVAKFTDDTFFFSGGSLCASLCLSIDVEPC